MILRAVAFFELVIHEMNFAAAPFGAPLVTIQKLRTPWYWPDLAFCSVHGMPWYPTACTPLVKANDTKPIASSSVLTLFCTSPFDSSASALGDIFSVSPRKMSWKAACVPEEAMRSTRSIGPLIFAPGTSLHSRTSPVKIACTVCWLRFAIGFFGLVLMHTPSRAIFVNTSPLGSPSSGLRDTSPMSTRPAATSDTPTSEVPWLIFGVGSLVALW